MLISAGGCDRTNLPKNKFLLVFSGLRRSAIYVRIQPDWLSILVVREQGKAVEYADIPQVILQRHEKSGSIIKLLEVGSSTKTFPTNETRGIVRCNGFEHPRVLIEDLDVASETLKVFMSKALKGKRFLRTPRVIMHPLRRLEGGLAHLEVQALLDLTSRVSVGLAEGYGFHRERTD